MRGGDRSSKSTKQLKESGSYRSAKHGGRVSVVTIQHLAPPDFYDDEHLELWGRTVQSLVDFEILAKQHYDSIRLYVETLVVQRKAYATFTKEGITVEINGKMITHPAFRVYKDCDAILKPLREQFGFTPRALQGMKTRPSDDEPKDDPTAEFFKGPPVKPRAEA